MPRGQGVFYFISDPAAATVAATAAAAAAAAATAPVHLCSLDCLEFQPDELLSAIASHRGCMLQSQLYNQSDRTS